MKRFWQASLFLSVAALAVAAGFYLNPVTRDGGGADEIDARAVLTSPLADLRGESRRLEEWAGKVLVVNFWATWCPPCLEEIPIFIGMQERLGDRGLQFVGIAIDDLERVRVFVDRQGLNYPTLVGQADAMALSDLAGNARGGLPYTLVFDRSGEILSRHYGALTRQKLESIVLPAL
ncbi:MAG: TlpA disulfide reductase family protein [Burkholderiales bacterium]